jgi:hypothetical protein
MEVLTTREQRVSCGQVPHLQGGSGKSSLESHVAAEVHKLQSLSHHPVVLQHLRRDSKRSLHSPCGIDPLSS